MFVIVLLSRGPDSRRLLQAICESHSQDAFNGQGPPAAAIRSIGGHFRAGQDAMAHVTGDANTEAMLMELQSLESRRVCKPCGVQSAFGRHQVHLEDNETFRQAGAQWRFVAQGFICGRKLLMFSSMFTWSCKSILRRGFYAPDQVQQFEMSQND